MGPGKKPKLPPEPDPTPTPVDIDLEAQRRADDVRRKLKSKKGRRGTVLTEDVATLGIEDNQKKSILGA